MKNFTTRYKKLARLRGVSCGTMKVKNSQNMAELLSNLSILAKFVLISTKSCVGEFYKKRSPLTF